MAEKVRMPRLAEDMEAGRVVEWLKGEGDSVSQGDPLLLVDSDKAEVEIESPASGYVGLILAQVGDDVEVGEVLTTIGDAPPATDELSAARSSDDDPVPPVSTSDEEAQLGVTKLRRPASPAARRVAKELGVDVTSLPGTGADGLVTEGDVRAFADWAITGSSVDEGAPTGTESNRIPLTGMRRRIAERLAMSRRTAADVTTVNDVDMTAIDALREGTGFSYTAYVVWAASRSLRAFPKINATFGGAEIVLRSEVNIGVAVAVPDGLVVPVIRNVDSRSPADISGEIEAVAERIRGGGLQPQDVSGGTFTVTNSGGFGSLFFTPIINLPEVAILGVGRVSDAPVVREGVLAVGRVMYLSLTYDHRAVDGAEAVSFLVDLKQRLEHPEIDR